MSQKFYHFLIFSQTPVVVGCLYLAGCFDTQKLAWKPPPPPPPPPPSPPPPTPPVPGFDTRSDEFTNFKITKPELDALCNGNLPVDRCDATIKLTEAQCKILSISPADVLLLDTGYMDILHCISMVSVMLLNAGGITSVMGEQALSNIKELATRNCRDIKKASSVENWWKFYLTKLVREDVCITTQEKTHRGKLISAFTQWGPEKTYSLRISQANEEYELRVTYQSLKDRTVTVKCSGQQQD